jgi:hypothetical protein
MLVRLSYVTTKVVRPLLIIDSFDSRFKDFDFQCRLLADTHNNSPTKSSTAVQYSSLIESSLLSLHTANLHVTRYAKSIVPPGRWLATRPTINPITGEGSAIVWTHAASLPVQTAPQLRGERTGRGWNRSNRTFYAVI